jgi:uncharacterized membrane protein YciS (DUF1049 family)
MTRVTIVTKLRLIAAIAPAILVAASIYTAGGLYVLGRLPRSLYDNHYTALRAANGMDNALYKMDWGRSQPDGKQIIEDQQRRFVNQIGLARDRAMNREEADRIEKIAKAANPLFDKLRRSPGDDSIEAQLRDVESLILDLASTEEGELNAEAARAESESHALIAVVFAAGIAIPWACFAALAWITTGVRGKLREVRDRVEVIAERTPSDDVGAIDAALAELGFPKPNPMLAE